jgi:hypothetical protein
LLKQPQTLGGDYSAFESSSENATKVCANLPDEMVHRFSLSLHPAQLGTDVRDSFIGLMGDQAGFIDSISFITALKLSELACGIAEALNHAQFRIAVMCCRALYEEAAAARLYLGEVRAALEALRVVPASTFRLRRLKSMAANRRDEFASLLKTVSAANASLRKWHSATKIDIGKPDFFDNYKLAADDPLYQKFTLRGLKEIKWGGKPAEMFYALLCDATHPNVGAVGLYIEEVKIAGHRIEHKIKRDRKSSDVYWYVFDLICRPTIECVAILLQFLDEMRLEKQRLDCFLRKVRATT